MPSANCPAGWQRLTRADNGWPAGIGEGTGFGPVGRIEIAVAPSQPNVIYAEAIHPQDFSIIGLWRSGDGGQTWAARARPANLRRASRRITGLPAQTPPRCRGSRR